MEGQDMTDYTKLVAALRHCNGPSWLTCQICQYNNDMMTCAYKMLRDAAAAIEELQETLEAVQTNSGINFRMWEEAQAEVERLQAQLLKRGEIVRCRECRWGHLCVTGQHLGLDGFCSKGEREAQE